MHDRLSRMRKHPRIGSQILCANIYWRHFLALTRQSPRSTTSKYFGYLNRRASPSESMVSEV